MNYFLKELAEKSTIYYFELTILIIVCILLILSIIILTMVKSLKDK